MKCNFGECILHNVIRQLTQNPFSSELLDISNGPLDAVTRVMLPTGIKRKDVKVVPQRFQPCVLHSTRHDVTNLSVFHTFFNRLNIIDDRTYLTRLTYDPPDATGSSKGDRCMELNVISTYQRMIIPTEISDRMNNIFRQKPKDFDST